MLDKYNIRCDNSDRQFLSFDVSNCLKGIFAVMVLISHLHGRVGIFSSSILGTLFSAFGYLAVSGFFFLSGYGLTQQSRKENYVKDFPKRKILPFYLLVITAVLIYIVVDLIFSRKISLLLVVRSFWWGGTVIDNGWYLQTQLLFYIFFFIAFRFTKKRSISVFTLLLAYVVVCYLLSYPSTWYEASFAFLLGIVFSEKKAKIEELISKNKTVWGLIALLLVFFVIALFFGNKPYLPFIPRILVKMLSSVLFVILAIAVSCKIKLEFAVTRWLGKYSLGIYVIQGIFLSALRPVIQNDWLYIAATIIATLVAAIPTEFLFKEVASLTKKK